MNENKNNLSTGTVDNNINNTKASEESISQKVVPQSIQTPKVQAEQNQQVSASQQPAMPQKINQGVSTNAPTPEIAQSIPNTIPEVQTTNITTPETENKSEEPEKKEGIFKYILAFIFIIAFAGFVIFIPEISKYVKTKMGEKKNTGDSDLIESGTLICERDKTTDETDTKYKLKYVFDNKKLLTSNYETTYESLDTDLLKQKEEVCNLIATTSKELTGIDTSCSNKNGILKIIEEYTNQDIDKTKLTAYTESGGTYPEFEYGENIYDIQSKLVKQGYDCKISSVQE